MFVQRCEERTTRSIGLFHLYLIRTNRFNRYQAETVRNLPHGQAVDRGDQDQASDGLLVEVRVYRMVRSTDEHIVAEFVDRYS